MNAVTGRADELEKHESGEVWTASRQITTTTDGVVELGEPVRLPVETADHVGEPATSVALGTHIAPLVDRAREDYSEATVETELPAGATAPVPHAKLLGSASETPSRTQSNTTTPIGRGLASRSSRRRGRTRTLAFAPSTADLASPAPNWR
jgi:hypothetical protein